jgi:hypothetical protein
MDFVFVVIFTIEAAIRIFALGFVCGKYTYMRNEWNVLDFTIVLSGIFEFASDLLEFKGINLRILRILRILRPLKAFKTTPSL